MKRISKKKKIFEFWANFSLFFYILLISVAIVGIASVAQAIVDPTAPPPGNNNPELLRIDDIHQAKSGALRLGSSDVISPFVYQLEVLGNGAYSTNAIIDNDVTVNASSQTLYVDSKNNTVCIGSCIGDAQARLEVGDGDVSVRGVSNTAVQAVSADSEAIFGDGQTYGIQGTASGVSNYGVWAVSTLSTAIEGVHLFAADDPIGFWRLDEGSGTSSADSSPSNNSMTTINFAQWTTSGYSANALDFDGTGPRSDQGFIDNSDGDLDTVDALTFEFWFYPRAYETSLSVSLIDNTWGGPNTSFRFYWTQATGVSFETYTGIPPGINTSVNTNMVLDQWYYVVGTYENNGQSGNQRIYIDGKLVGSLNQTGKLQGNKQNFYIGDDPTTLEPFNGLIDEIKIYDRAKTSSEIAANYLGQHLGYTYSSVAGISDTGFGVYGTNKNAVGLWSGYFDGIVESSEDIAGTKILASGLQNSLVPFTSGQIAGEYFKQYFPQRIVSDGQYLWVGQGGNFNDEVLKIDKGTGEIVTTIPQMGPTEDLIYDSTNEYIWQAAATYSGRINRVSTSTGLAESRVILDSDGQGTCPMGFITLDPTDSDIMWAIHPGGSCFGREYYDRLYQLRISDYTNDPSKWVPIATYDIVHDESITPPYSQRPRALEYDQTNGSLWVAFQTNDQVYQIAVADPGAGDNIITSSDYNSFAVPGPTDVAYDSGRNYLWVSSDDDNNSNDGAYYIDIAGLSVSSKINVYAGLVGPQAIAYDGTFVWVATTNSTSGYLDRFPANDTSTISHFPTNSNRSYRDILVDTTIGVVWVPSWYGSSIASLSTSDGSIQDIFDYGVIDFTIHHFDGTFIWATRANDLYKIRASDGFVVFQVTVGNNLTDVLFDGNYVWVLAADDDGVIKLNPYDGSTECIGVLAAGSSPQSITFDGQYYWVTAAGTGDIVKVNNTCGFDSVINVTSQVNSLGKIIYNGSYLWAISSVDDAVINLNPSSEEAMVWTGLAGFNPQDIYYDNYHYWVANQGANSVTSFYLSSSKVCAEDGVTSCQVDSDCTNGCFAVPQSRGSYATGNEPASVNFDGTYIWTANKGDNTLSQLLAADPAVRKDYSLTFQPIGLLFDGSYLWTSGTGNAGYQGITKVLTGTDYGTNSIDENLTLEDDTSLQFQTGSFSVDNSAIIGSDITIDGDIDGTNNVWGESVAGDVIANGGSALGAGTFACPAGHYITNITVNGLGEVTQIDCRSL